MSYTSNQTVEDCEAKQWQYISHTDKPHKQAMGVLCHSAALCKGWGFGTFCGASTDLNSAVLKVLYFIPKHRSFFLLTTDCLCPAEFQSQVARHREAQTLVPRVLTVPDAERIARKKKRRRRRWERQQRAAAQQPIRFLEGYAAVPHPVAMLAPSFASKTGTDSYDDEEDYILDEDSSSGTG